MLSTTKKVLPVVALAAAFTLGLGGEAQAQHGHGFHSGGHHGVRHGGHVYGSQPSLHVPGHFQSHYPSHSIQWHQPRYHDTTHLDYHAPSFKRHRNHFHYQPGHYDVHRTGHWH
ncbi:hypothetical protein [Rhodopirellula baltica]|uniref:Secreted protein n=2 Tax=Rhodopirellula baltica TaxID=265606 RepID=K5EC22_RHOBT|nr:hypothetical protein [Rhodopirellula baltica]EKK03406.1 hypothetical protein RBSH_01268 [Rhodopirellula baltica SH28]ELP30051.1 hypothetical protein RBSWK_06139 [Rhodopirellula baltica SWK14]